MSDVRRLLGDAAARLGGDDARFEAELLLAHALDRTRAWLFAWPEFEPDAARRTAFECLVEARLAGEPVAYLTGHREFWSLDLAVTPDVLIPRPETELLVELALARIDPATAAAVADLGTGSGAIALAVAHARPRARVTATDSSARALAVARGNALRLGIANVEFSLGDWCEALGEVQFDVIVSNPPYIATGDAHLVRGDLRREPATALASGVDGLDAIRTIAAGAAAHLRAEGVLLIEHGFAQGNAVRNILCAHGFSAMTTADLEGRERVTAASVCAG